MAEDRVDGPLRITVGWAVPAAELDWRFSRSSGPGGQGVNTTDSRVELSWSSDSSPTFAQLPEPLQRRLRERLAPRLVHGALVVTASEYRAQLRNREAARRRLAQLLREALALPPRRRTATLPTRGSIERRLRAKKVRSHTLANRRSTSD